MIVPDEGPDAGRVPLCREPWENYYILRRCILPCCYGHKAIAPMSAWRTAWNSEILQDIRAHLAKGELSQYCRTSLSCPIVQRHMDEKQLRALVTSPAAPVPATSGPVAPPAPPPSRPVLLRVLNRLLFRLPGRIYRGLNRQV